MWTYIVRMPVDNLYFRPTVAPLPYIPSQKIAERPRYAMPHVDHAVTRLSMALWASPNRPVVVPTAAAGLGPIARYTVIRFSTAMAVVVAVVAEGGREGDAKAGLPCVTFYHEARARKISLLAGLDGLSSAWLELILERRWRDTAIHGCEYFVGMKHTIVQKCLPL